MRPLTMTLLWGALATVLSACSAAPPKTAASAASGALTLAQNGKSSYVIALAQNAIPAEKTAASELQSYLKQISGATLPIKPESEVAAASPQILVGASTRAKSLLGEAAMKKIGSDGIAIKTIGRNLILTGDRPRGTLYAVYEFLEKQAGVRWWTPTESTIPKRSTLRVLAQNTLYTPPFAYRENFTTSVQVDPLFATQMRENGHFQKQDEKLGGHYSIIGWCHTFDQWLPPEKYFKAHPAWYSDPANGNKPCTAASAMPAMGQSQLNLTDEAMRAELTKVVLQRIREDPTAGIISVSQNDNGNYCQSAGDMKVIEREGSPSGPLIEMVNQVAADVQKEFPGFLVETLAYSYSSKPPKTVRPSHDVLVRLCTGSDFSRPLDSDANADFRSFMAGWRAIAPRLLIWDYVTNFNSVIWPHPNLRVLAPNLRYFARNQPFGVFEQGDAYSNGVGDFVQLRAWLLSKLMWNPQRDQAQLENEFLRGYYGAAAPHLRAYLDGIQDAFAKSGGRLSPSQADSSYLTLDVVGRAWQQFQAAQNAVKNDAVLSQRVRRERLVLDHVIIERYPILKRENAAREYSPSPLPQDIIAFTDDFIKTAHENHVFRYRESEAFDNLEGMLRARYAAPQPLPEELRAPLESAVREGRVIDAQEGRFRYFGRGALSDIVDDAQASGGKAGRMLGSGHDWAMQFDIQESPEVLTKAPWHIYLVVRIETKPGATIGGTAFSSGVFDVQQWKSRFDKVVPLDATLADGKYHVIDLGRSELGSGCFLYVAPPRRDDIAYVYVDRAILVREK